MRPRLPGGIPGWLRLLKVDPAFFRNDLSLRLPMAPEGPGIFHLLHGTPFEYAREMTMHPQARPQPDQCW